MRNFLISQAIISFYETVVNDLFIPHVILNRSEVWKSYTFILTIIVYVCFQVKKSSFYSSVLFGSASSATSGACSYMYGAQMLCASNILILFCLMCFI
jgi:hypothetical protein